MLRCIRPRETPQASYSTKQLQTAKALGFTILQSLLPRAEEVIQ